MHNACTMRAQRVCHRCASEPVGRFAQACAKYCETRNPLAGGCVREKMPGPPVVAGGLGRAARPAQGRVRSSEMVNASTQQPGWGVGCSVFGRGGECRAGCSAKGPETAGPSNRNSAPACGSSIGVPTTHARGRLPWPISSILTWNSFCSRSRSPSTTRRAAARSTISSAMPWTPTATRSRSRRRSCRSACAPCRASTTTSAARRGSTGAPPTRRSWSWSRTSSPPPGRPTPTVPAAGARSSPPSRGRSPIWSST